MVFVTRFRSNADLLVLSLLCAAYENLIPHLTIDREQMYLDSVSTVLSDASAYLGRRSFQEDPLYAAIFQSFTQVCTNGFALGGISRLILTLTWTCQPTALDRQAPSNGVVDRPR